MQGTVRPFFQQKLWQIGRRDKIVLFYFVGRLAGLLVPILLTWSCGLRHQLSITVSSLGGGLDRRTALRLFVCMQVVPRLLLVTCSLDLLVVLVYLFDWQFLTELLLGCAFDLLRRLLEVVFRAVNCVFAICHGVARRLGFLIAMNILVVLGRCSILVSWTDRSSRFWRFSATLISRWVLVGVQGW